MKKITIYYAMTLMALAILFFSCNGKSPRMPEPEVPKNPKEKLEPKKPEPPVPTPEPPVPTPPAPAPTPPAPPAPKPPKDRVLTMVGQWAQTWSTNDYEIGKDEWKPTPEKAKYTYIFRADGNWEVTVEVEGIGSSRSSGTYQFVGKKLTIVNGGTVGIKGTFEVEPL